ncbi:MAG: carboxypeptidase-like regulatory domain-containing protein, partial [Gemmatimonadota bacterium]|nr:carboxypeptidase-like regulatory domain-containing protein [Gemmatimonadota bacterium]
MAPRRTAAVLIALAIADGTRVGGAQAPAAPVTASRPIPSGGILLDSGASLVLIELRLGNLASVTVPAYRVREHALMPLSALLQQAEIRHQVGVDGTVTALVQPGSVPLVVAASADTMTYGTHRVVVAREIKLLEDGELFVSTHALAELLGIDFVVNWPELTVTITDPSSLPIGRRVSRDAAREALLRRGEAPAGPVVNYALERPRWDGLVLDYAITTPSADPLHASSYVVAAGMNAFGGSLETTVAGVGVAGARAVGSTASWTGVWADNGWLKQLRIGDGVSTGSSPRLVRGVSVTNSPFLRSSHFAVTDVSGLLAPGWEVEAYRAGHLIGFDSVDALGRYQLPVPTEYGENYVDFVAYGPFGEVRHFNHAYRVGSDLLPARRFEYGASLGSCIGGICAGTANLDLRYGVSSRWAVRAGYDGFRRDTLGSLSHPYAGVSGSLTDAVGVQLESVWGALARGGLRYEPSTRLRLSGEYTHFAQDGSVPLLTPTGWRARWLVSGLLRPNGLTGSRYLEGYVARVETATGTITRARLGASVTWRDVRIFPFARLEQGALAGASAPRRSFVGVHTSVLPRTAWGPVFGHTWVRATLEVEPSAGLSEASVAVARLFAHGLRVEVGARRTPASTVATLLTSLDLAAVRSYTSVLVPRAGIASATEYLQGSVVVNTATREVTLAPGPSLQRSGIAGRVFLDQNTNGLADVGEPTLPRVTLRAGGAAATSDSSGWFEIWNMPPFEPALVTVDSMSLPSPLWVPGFATMTVVPGPNRFVLVDVPIVPGGVVEGRVVLETPTGRQGLGNAEVTLIERLTDARRVLTTFSDGEFLAVGVRPGSYEATVGERLLTQLQATAEPGRFVLAADPD